MKGALAKSHQKGNGGQVTSVLFKVPRAGLILGGFWVFTPRVRAQHATMGSVCVCAPSRAQPTRPWHTSAMRDRL